VKEHWTTTGRRETTVADRRTFDLVIAANRLPVDRYVDPDGTERWRRSPGGLVTAMDSVMRGRDGAWVGWAGDPGEAPAPFDEAGMWLHPVAISQDEVEDYYEGFSNDTLWPIYHDVIVPARFHRVWWQAYERVNRRFAEAVRGGRRRGCDGVGPRLPAPARAADGARAAPDVRIGWFNHIPFPPVRALRPAAVAHPTCSRDCSAPTIGFQRTADAQNFIRSCRRHLDATTKRVTIGSPRRTEPQRTG
jgi:trehalose 6-phosphate synthase